MPEYPETSTNSGVPLADDAVEGGEQGIDLALLARTVSRESAAGLACRVRRAGIRRCGAEFPIRQGSAEDHSQRRLLSGSVPRPSWRAAS